MNTQAKIEQFLRAAPKPLAPDSLVDKLRRDVILREVETRESALRKFFAPSGERISYWRIAAAAVITMAVLLPLGYGATKLIKGFVAIRQLPAMELGFLGGALSPDGKHFAGISRGADLVVFDTSTGEQRKLAEKCEGGRFVWSADGSEIAYVGRSGDKEAIVAVAFRAGDKRVLLELEGDKPWLLEDWSSDGKLILGGPREGACLVSAVMVNLESKKETVLVEDVKESEYSWPSPRFSPKGDLVNYVTTEEAGRSTLHLRTIDGTSEVKYTGFPGEIGRQCLWSPDGTYLVFVGIERGTDEEFRNLWALRVQGGKFVGEPLAVVPVFRHTDFFNWSRTGQLAYRTNLWRGGLFVLSVDLQTGRATGAPRRSNPLGGGMLPCHGWSPDGNQIAVCKLDGWSIVSVVSGKKIRDLFSAGYQKTGIGLSWSPDGKSLAHPGRDKDKRAGVCLIGVETGDIKLLVLPQEEGGGDVDDVTWSADSKSIAYGYNGDVYVVNIEDGKPRRLTAATEEEGGKRSRFFLCPAFAPDGRSVAYIAANGPKSDTVMATTIDGKETREIFHWKDGRVVFFSWSPDGRHIVFTPADSSHEIWCAPTDGGKPFRMADLGEETVAWRPQWSPKGDAISFNVAHEESKYWVMENFLPSAEVGGR